MSNTCDTVEEGNDGDDNLKHLSNTFIRKFGHEYIVFAQGHVS